MIWKNFQKVLAGLQEKIPHLKSTLTPRAKRQLYLEWENYTWKSMLRGWKENMAVLVSQGSQKLLSERPLLPLSRKYATQLNIALLLLRHFHIVAPFIMEAIQFCAVIKTFIASDTLGFIWPLKLHISGLTYTSSVSILTLHPALGSSFIPAVPPLADDYYVLLSYRIVDARELAFAKE